MRKGGRELWKMCEVGEEIGWLAVVSIKVLLVRVVASSFTNYADKNEEER